MACKASCNSCIVTSQIIKKFIQKVIISLKIWGWYQIWSLCAIISSKKLEQHIIFVEARLKRKHTIFHILQYWWQQQHKCIQQKRVMDFLHWNIVTKITQEQTRTKSLPLQPFGHSTNLCRTHDHQTGEAPQVYLTYISTVALRIKCCKY